MGYILLSLCVGIGISCIFGAITKSINENKGRDGGFAWGFWLGWIGIIVVACRPSEERYVPPSRNDWRCACGRTHPQYISTCGTCGYTKEKAMAAKSAIPGGAVPTGSWRCICGRINGYYMSTCVCGVSKRAIVTSAPATPAAPVAPAAPAAPAAPVRPVANSSMMPPQANRPAPAPAAQGTVSEQERLKLLREYKELLDSGVLTQEEFDTKKKQLLEMPAQTAPELPKEKFCTQCGTKQSADRTACWKCGAPMQ